MDGFYVAYLTGRGGFADGIVVSIQTPFGPVNAKISKLRDFSF
jgi:hypothetical protein